MNVLILSASREVALVRSFQRDLAEIGGRVIAGDMSPLAPALYVADDHAILPPSDSPDFVPFLFELCGKRDVRLMLSPRDEDLPILAEHRAAFAEVGTTVMVADSDTILTCRDKLKFVEFCRRHGFATPTTFDATEPKPADFPLFVKPRIGKGGQSTFRVESIEQLDAVGKLIDDILVQEFVDAPEYTIDLFSDFDGQVISVLPRERLRIVGGESYVAVTARIPVLLAECARLAQSLKLVGHNTIQAFRVEDEVKFIEVNPRYGGGAHLGFAAGARTTEFLVRLLSGEKLRPCIGDFKDRYFMLRHTQDLFLSESSLKRGDAL